MSPVFKYVFAALWLLAGHARSLRVERKPQATIEGGQLVSAQVPDGHYYDNASLTTAKKQPCNTYWTNPLIMTIHHLKGSKVWKRASQHLPKSAGKAPTLDGKLFCATWVKPMDDPGGGPEMWINEIDHVLSGCDGHMLMSNFNADRPVNITKVHEGPSGQNERSMVQYLSAWKYLATHPEIKQYDWFVMLESDHFIQPLLWKQALAEEISRGTVPTSPAMFAQSNVFFANKAMLAEMMVQWDVIYNVNDKGCPHWAPWSDATEGLCHGDCQADITTPLIPAAMREGSARMVKPHFSLLDRFKCTQTFIEMQHVENVGMNRWAAFGWLKDIAKYDPSVEVQGRTLGSTASAAELERIAGIESTLEGITSGKIKVSERMERAIKDMHDYMMHQ